jgi:hypothetical protein
MYRDPIPANEPPGRFVAISFIAREAEQAEQVQDDILTVQ